MTTYLLIFVAALALALGATPVARRLALKTGVVDSPSERSLHARVMPRLGGAAIYAAVVIALLAFGDRFYISQLAGILLGATLVSFLGIWDDRWGMRPLLKLLGQVAAALVLVQSGVKVELLGDDYLNGALTVLWVVGITNSLNLLDNMDGLSGGVAAVAAAFFFLLAAMNGQFLVASLAAALLGACSGFLFYNFNPARIFMGDTGSLFLGYALAALGIKLRFESSYVITWMIPVLILGIPIFDTTLVVISRLRRGLNPLTSPGRDHVSHRLVSLGWTHREAVMALYLVGGMLGIVAILLTKTSLVESYTIAGVIVLAGLVGLVLLERVPPLARPTESTTEAQRRPQGTWDED